MVDLANEGQRHGEHHSQWSHLMANTNLHIVYLNIFAIFRRCRDIHISKCVTLKMYVKVTMYNITNDIIYPRILLTNELINGVGEHASN